MQLMLHREGEDFQAPLGPVRLRVNTSDKALTPENGETEVAILCLGSGHVTFDRVVKADQLLQPFAMNDQVIKGRQETYRRGHWHRVRRRQRLLQVVWLHKIALLQALDRDWEERTLFRHGLHSLPHSSAGVWLQIGDLVLGRQAVTLQGTADEMSSIRQRCRPGGVDVRWQDALGEIKVLLKAASIRHQQASGVEEVLERQFRRLPVPPGA